MPLHVVSVKENPLLKRKEALVLVEHRGRATPTRKELLAEAAKALGASPDAVVVEQIMTDTGRSASKARVYAYDSAEAVPKGQREKQAGRLGAKKGAAKEGKK